MVFAPDVTSLMHWWVDPDGTVYPLDGSEGVALEHDWQGGGSPPVQIVSDQIPFRPGSLTRTVNVKENPIDLPLYVEGETGTQLRTRLDLIRYWFDPTRGEGRFRRRREDGTTRELWCRRTGGLRGNNATNWGRSEMEVVTLEATDDPYAYDLDDTTLTYATGSVLGGFFDPPFFPLKLTASTVLASPTITNDGQVSAWPVWTITGPGTDPVVRNLTTGLFFSFAYVLTASQQIIVDFRPPARRDTSLSPVRLASGDNLFGSMGGTTDPFPLVVGPNLMQMEMGGVSAASNISLTYRRRWLGL